jgi:citrate lyase beta subunit
MPRRVERSVTRASSVSIPRRCRAFAPSPEEVERARRLIDAYDGAVARGEAVVAFDGQMVDEPLARHARAVLAAAERGET